MELITQCVSHWRRGDSIEIATHICGLTSSFKKVTHLVANRKHVDQVGPFGFTWTKEAGQPVYFALTVEIVEFPKDVKRKIARATEILDLLIAEADEKAEDSENEDETDIFYDLCSLIEDACKLKITIEKRQANETIGESGEYVILNNDKTLSDLIRGLEFPED